MNRHYPIVSARAHHVCEYCRAPEAVFNLPFEVEHVEPQAIGGETVLENLALSCRSCNLYKGVFTSGFDLATQGEHHLFHPRRDVWEEHFKFDQETGRIDGLTPSARATVARLQMNSVAQTEARQQWVRLGFDFVH